MIMCDRLSAGTRPIAAEEKHGYPFQSTHLEEPGAVQTAQSLARDRGHQRLEPMHLLAALLDPEQQVIRSC